MVRAPRSVNGLAWEILFFLKNSDPKELAGRILGSEFQERRGLGWSPVEHPAQGIFGGRDAQEGD